MRVCGIGCGTTCANKNNLKRYLVNYNGTESLIKCDLHGILEHIHVCVELSAFRFANINFMLTITRVSYENEENGRERG